jgi:hypothetical protein
VHLIQRRPITGAAEVGDRKEVHPVRRVPSIPRMSLSDSGWQHVRVDWPHQSGSGWITGYKYDSHHLPGMAPVPDPDLVTRL